MLGKTWTTVVVMSGWFLSILTMVAILAISLILMLKGQPLPSPLGDWASVALGFLFGNVFNLVRGYVSQDEQPK